MCRAAASRRPPTSPAARRTPSRRGRGRGLLRGRRLRPGEHAHARRPSHACGRAEERYATAARIVPRDALVAVGTFDFDQGRIRLTGSESERAVAGWLGTPRLDPAELARGARGRRTAAHAARTAPDVPVAVTPSLGEALIERAGIRHGSDGVWVGPEGRQTSAITEALVWALVTIAEET